MSTWSTEETSWLEDQVRHCTAGLSWDRLTEQTSMILEEVGAHTEQECTTLCRSSLERKMSSSSEVLAIT